MPRYEYKVVPAPTKASKIKGLKGTDQRFAAALAELMNQYGQDGWEYQRTDTLPVEERQGLTGKTTTFQNMLIFRREIGGLAEEPQTPAAVTKSEPMLAVPTFRSTAQPLPPLAADHEGDAPRLGAARHPEPSKGTRAPDIAAH